MPSDTPIHSGQRVQIQAIQSRVQASNKAHLKPVRMAAASVSVGGLLLTSDSLLLFSSRTHCSISLAFPHSAQMHHDFTAGSVKARSDLKRRSPSDAQSNQLLPHSQCTRGPVPEQIVRETMSKGEVNSGSFLCVPGWCSGRRWKLIPIP